MNEPQKLDQGLPHDFSDMEEWIIHSCLAPAVQQALREAKEKETVKRPGRYLLARGRASVPLLKKRRLAFSTLMHEAAVSMSIGSGVR